MELTERHALVQRYLGQIITITIDRPIGTVHPKKTYTLVYPINYGYIPGVIGGDGEELDVYLVGVKEAVQTYQGRIVGIVYRENDVEDKLIMAPVGQNWSADQIVEAIEFQERYYQTHVEVWDGLARDL